jgi:nicotinamidase-related amidase
MVRLVRVFRERKKPIIHVVRIYLADGSNVDLCRRKLIIEGKKALVPGSDGVELMNELKPSKDVRLNANLLLSGRLQEIGLNEWVVYKPRWGAFYKTPLEEHLHNLKVNTLIFLWV